MSHGGRYPGNRCRNSGFPDGRVLGFLAGSLSWGCDIYSLTARSDRLARTTACCLQHRPVPGAAHQHARDEARVRQMQPSKNTTPLVATRRAIAIGSTLSDRRRIARHSSVSFLSFIMELHNRICQPHHNKKRFATRQAINRTVLRCLGPSWEGRRHSPAPPRAGPSPNHPAAVATRQRPGNARAGHRCQHLGATPRRPAASFKAISSSGLRVSTIFVSFYSGSLLAVAGAECTHEAPVARHETASLFTIRDRESTRSSRRRRRDQA